MPATGALIGTPASIRPACEPQVEPIEVEPLDSSTSDVSSMVYGNDLAGGDDRAQGALGQRAVADLAPAGAAHRTRFADRVGREVVEVHVVLFAVLFQRVHHLRVVAGAEDQRGQHLGLAAREQAGAVDTGQQADFAGDLADVGRAAPVGPLAFGQDQIAQLLFDDLIGGFFDVGDVVRVLLLETASTTSLMSRVRPASREDLSGS